MDFLRQLDIFDPNIYKTSVTVIGTGSVGSFTALTLGKMGVNRLVLYDPDRIEPHNIPNQFYPASEVGEYKVEALSRMISQFCDGVKIRAKPVEYTSQLISTPIVVSAVDSKETRRDIYSSLLRIASEHIYPKLYIDTRMGGLVGAVYALTDLKHPNYEYLESLEGDGEQLPCTAQSIIFNVLTLASVVASYIRNWVMGKPIPFVTTFDTNTFQFLFHDG